MAIGLVALVLLAGCRDGSPSSSAASTAPSAPGGAAAARPPVTTLPATRYAVAGLKQGAEILVDRAGVPHIYAESPEDLYFAQGFNAARDRLWQLDLWKRRGEGRLAEAFGPSFVEQDRAARLFRYRGELAAEYAAYGPDTEAITTAFAAGINGYIDLAESRPELMPPEFGWLAYRPLRWTAEGIVRSRSHALSSNAASELDRALFVRDHGLEPLPLYEQLEPAHEVRVPDESVLARLSERSLDGYTLARAPVRFPADLREQLGLAGPPAPAPHGLRFDGPSPPSPALPLLGTAARGMGSNSWAVAPSRTASGRALLANDPHRSLTVPSLRYLVHLVGPGLDVIGAGEPALPGISIGHNGRIAFGLTVFWIDQEDVYVYETAPGQPDRYRYGDGWDEMACFVETIAVRGEPSRSVVLKFTRHGPVVHEDHGAHTAVAVRTVWQQPGTAAYLAGLAIMRAKGWEEFRRAMARWGAPPENLVYADAGGAIGWQPGGRAPVRPNWDGLLPVPGDGRYEWQGFVPADELPREASPARGFIATANHMNLPAGYPHAVGYEWSSSARFDRIVAVLGASSKLSVGDMARLQQDVLSLPARRLVRLLAGLSSPDAGVERALALLRGWDGRLAPESPAAALFELWYRVHLGPLLVRRVVADAAAARALGGGDPAARLALLERPDRRLGADPAAERDRILLESLASAVASSEALLGPDWAHWRWGRLHHAQPVHPLSAVVDEAARRELELEAVPRGGSADTVCKTTWTSSDFRQQLGATLSFVIDVGRWDGSVATNAPGQSGDPRSPHYRDLYAAWAAGETFPLPYSRAAVERAAAQRITLAPAVDP